jgi:LmbE family N-acetylglucosaminyl deacetylase
MAVRTASVNTADARSGIAPILLLEVGKSEVVLEKRLGKGTPRWLAGVGLLLVLSLLGPSLLFTPAGAQVRPVYDYGGNGLGGILRRLQTTASVMHTGAHPDDEDSALLAFLARGLSARTAYLSLTRGDGGQNLLGSEQSESLGVIRTEELLQARRLDGAEQYFTRAFDYGFSKTLDEAKSKWPEHDVLGDMVRDIRLFRPLVVISRFSGTPADGHGQHQFAGYLTPIAVKAAADPEQFPEQIQAGLRPWKVRKFYVGMPFNSTEKPTVRIDTGKFDPLLGRSYFEIAIEGRSLHRTQGEGRLEIRGPHYSGERLVNGVETYKGEDTDLLTGLDTSLGGLGQLTGVADDQFNQQMVKVQTAAANALAQFDPMAPQKLIQTLVEGLRAIRVARARLQRLPDSISRYDADFFAAAKEAEFTEALRRAVGVELDVLADRETVAPGDTVSINTQVWFQQTPLVRLISLGLINTPAGWSMVQEGDGPVASEKAAPGETDMRQGKVKQTAAPDLAATQPYWLMSPRDHDLFHWPDANLHWSPNDPLGLPFTPTGFNGAATFDIGGISVRFSQPLQFRTADPARGEVRRNVDVLPVLTLKLDQDLLIVASNTAAKPHQLVVNVTNNADRAVTGELKLRLPAGWSATPAVAPLSFAKKGDRITTTFTVTAAGKPAEGATQIVAEATADGKAFAQEMRVLSYPHIQTHRIYEPAAVALNVLDLKVAPVRVGYIMGPGDEVPDAIERMGVPVTLLDEAALTGGDLSRFDVIVVGVRATDARPDFVANNQRLLDYAKAGGTLIVQYQRTNYADLKLPPFPTKMGPRVTDETAAVTVLHPDDQLLNWPNKIVAKDWDGWIQERTVYGFSDFDPQYVPQFEMKDPGEATQNGSEVIAHLGKGLYIYTSFAWFRQLPAGVPGAYRLFANLLSRGKNPKGK